MIKTLLTLAICIGLMSLCFILLTQTSYIWFINQARRRGVYPRGEVSIDDVKDLIRQGEYFLAVHAYRQMYGLSFRQAKKEVSLLERHLEPEETV